MYRRWEKRGQEKWGQEVNRRWEKRGQEERG